MSTSIREFTIAAAQSSSVKGEIARSEKIERAIGSLGFERVVFIPNEPGDEIGHSDGMCRFLNKRIARQTPKFSRYLGFVAMSRGPLRQPARSPARSRQEVA